MVVVMHFGGISGIFQKFCPIVETFPIVVVSDPFLQLTGDCPYILLLVGGGYGCAGRRPAGGLLVII